MFLSLSWVERAPRKTTRPTYFWWRSTLGRLWFDSCVDGVFSAGDSLFLNKRVPHQGSTIGRWEFYLHWLWTGDVPFQPVHMRSLSVYGCPSGPIHSSLDTHLHGVPSDAPYGKEGHQNACYSNHWCLVPSLWSSVDSDGLNHVLFFEERHQSIVWRHWPCFCRSEKQYFCELANDQANNFVASNLVFGIKRQLSLCCYHLPATLHCDQPAETVDAFIFDTC